jgi:hypothetical protein
MHPGRHKADAPVGVFFSSFTSGKLQMQLSNAMHDNEILLSELDNAGMNIQLEVDEIQAHLDKVSLEKADLRFQNGGLKLR